MSRTYKIYGLSAATANGLASIRVTKSGTIRSITFAVLGVAGATVDTRLAAECSKQNTGSFAINDAPDVVLATVALPAPTVSGGGISGSVSVPNLGCPVSPNDTLYLNVLVNGTAPTSVAWYVTVSVA